MADKIRAAVIGVGSFTGNYACSGCADEQIVALCDVDRRMLEERGAQFPEAARYTDYRLMFEDMADGIDAVTISTPDHTHYAMAMAAIERGKHVFVQKPMARTVGEARALRTAAAEHNVITQMGNQGHTGDDIRLVREWVKAGLIGRPLEVHAWTDRPRQPWFAQPEALPLPAEPVPAWLDWEAWLASAAERPYNHAYVPKNWRTYWDFGCGALGDMGCHILDAPFWALDLGAPSKIEVELDDEPDPAYTAFGAEVVYHFPAEDGGEPLTLTWYEGGREILLPPDFEEDRELPANAMYIMGDKGTLMTFGAQADSPAFVPETRMVQMRKALPEPSIPRVEGGPIAEWLRAIKGEGPTPGSNFEYAAPLTELVLLGTIAIRSGRTLEWDADGMCFPDAPELEAWLQIP